MMPFPLPATPLTPAPDPVFLYCLQAPDVEQVVRLSTLSIELISWAVAGFEAMPAPTIAEPATSAATRRTKPWNEFMTLPFFGKQSATGTYSAAALSQL